MIKKHDTILMQSLYLLSAQIPYASASTPPVYPRVSHRCRIHKVNASNLLIFLKHFHVLLHGRFRYRGPRLHLIGNADHDVNDPNKRSDNAIRNTLAPRIVA